MLLEQIEKGGLTHWREDFKKKLKVDVGEIVERMRGEGRYLELARLAVFFGEEQGFLPACESAILREGSIPALNALAQQPLYQSRLSQDSKLFMSVFTTLVTSPTSSDHVIAGLVELCLEGEGLMDAGQVLQLVGSQDCARGHMVKAGLSPQLLRRIVEGDNSRLFAMLA